MGATIRVAIAGAAGRMGRELARAVRDAEGLALAAAIERAEHPSLGEAIEGVPLTADLFPALERCDVLVDFTAPPATARLADAAVKARVAFLSGTTGLREEDRAALARAAKEIAVLHAANLSIGVALLRKLASEAAAALPSFDIEIVEMHHRHKADAPSGTALEIARAIEAARPGLERVMGRSGRTGERRREEIGIHALRGGEVVGEHEVIFAGEGERVILAHRADSRAVLAAGAVRAIRFLAGRSPGLYGTSDLLQR
ncbi:MAG: 4-hydroxy-tetrahydrodipicolinate reductase [Candidatus Eisenbacteria bacterium]|nr:4-hydroxy-tetrahydrodipicolinate reductase [Candidatus Eisenbacteria bacterium]